MGQYFMWINPVKGEYMEPIDFGHGSKRTESSFVGDKILNVLYTLIDSDWKDDSIIWIGDEECRLHNETNPALKLAEQICGEMPYDYALDHFTDVSYQFSCAHKENVITGFFHENVFKRINLEEHYIEKWFEVDDIVDGKRYTDADTATTSVTLSIFSQSTCLKRACSPDGQKNTGS